MQTALITNFGSQIKLELRNSTIGHTGGNSQHRHTTTIPKQSQLSAMVDALYYISSKVILHDI